MLDDIEPLLSEAPLNLNKDADGSFPPLTSHKLSNPC